MMDTPIASTLPIPRLRLTRRSPSPHTSYGATTADNILAEPSPARSAYSSLSASNGRHFHGNNVEEDDDQPTPKMLTTSVSPSSSSGGGTPLPSSTPTDTPAARLRALLARVPYSPSVEESRGRPEETLSERESDFEPPRASMTTSIARESLKDLFSRALRDPGDTPQKGRRRRNSFDVSEVEITPMLNQERVENKGKRKSLSDEEIEKPSRSSQRSEHSFKSSHALTFDTLRARLASSQSQLMDQKLPTALFDASESVSFPFPGNTDDPERDFSSNANMMSLRPLGASTATLPDATSTPQRTLQMPSQMALESNLLEQDSEMQRVMEEFDNSEDSGPSRRPLSFPPSKKRPSEPHSQQLSSSAMRESQEKTSNDLHKSSSRSDGMESADDARDRAGLSQSVESVKDRQKDQVDRRNRKQERSNHERNRPRSRLDSTEDSRQSQNIRSEPRIPNRKSREIEKRESLTSLSGTGDNTHSQSSSMASQVDIRERISALEREVNVEREREWNKSKISRPSSSLGTHSSASHFHSHTHPPRPPSATPYSTPTHASLQRHASHSSVSSSRSVSPNGSSLASRESLQDRQTDEAREAAHERERGWNAPISRKATPKQAAHADRHKSPQSGSVDGSSNGKTGQPLRATSSLPSFSDHASIGNHQSLSSKLNAATTPSFHRTNTAPSSSGSHTSESRPQHPHHSAKNVSSQASEADATYATPSGVAGFGWHFPRHRVALPPFEPDQPSPERILHTHSVGSVSNLHHERTPYSPSPSPVPDSRPPSRISQLSKGSLIPVWSPSKKGRNENEDSGGHDTPDHGYNKGHRRGTTEFTEAVGRIPPRIPAEWTIKDVSQSSDKVVSPDSKDQSDLPERISSIQPPVESTSDADTEVLDDFPPRSSPQQHRSPSPNFVAGERSDDMHERKLFNSWEVPADFRREASSPEQAASGSGPRDMPLVEHESFSEVDAHSSLPLVTPRRLSFNMSKPEFKTPVTPTDVADHPHMLYSSDDELNVPHTSNLTTIATPRPPGAWATTPAPPRHRTPTPPFSQSDSTPTLASTSQLPPVSESLLQSEPLGELLEGRPVTPVSSRPRTSSLPTQTPAPPGAWVATPRNVVSQPGSLSQSGSQFGSVGKRKSILKVRFDVEPPESEGYGSVTEGKASVSTDSQHGQVVSEQPQTNGHTPVISSSNLHHDREGSPSDTPERPTTPVSIPSSDTVAPSPRSLRKLPNIRLVDAFGREQVDDNKQIDEHPGERTNQSIGDDRSAKARRRDNDRKTHREGKTSRDASSGVLSPSILRNSNRAAVRIVDAMGREVNDTSEQQQYLSADSVDQTNADALPAGTVVDAEQIGHNEALARVRQTLRDIAEGLSDVDRSYDDIALTDERLHELDEVSRVAREARNKLAQTLQSAKDSQHYLYGVSDAAGADKTKTTLLPTLAGTRQVSRYTLMISAFLVLQLTLMLAMYRYSHINARRLFYTTYYDPLYPELYSFTKVSTHAQDGSNAVSWSISALSKIFQQHGWRGVAAGIAEAIRRLQNDAWERWGEDYTQAWPPT